MSSLLTTSFIQDEVKDAFGYDIMCFEASDDMITRSIQKCVRTLNEYKPKISRHSIESVTTGEGTAVYVDFGVGAMGIRSVEFTSVTNSSMSDDPFLLYTQSLQGGSAMSVAPFDLDWYIIRLDRTQITNKLFGTADDFIWIEEEKRLILYVPNGPKNVYIEYFEAFTLPTQIMQEDDQVFLDMVTAQMKQKVGMMRRKYGGSLPAPGGVSIQLDGSDLVGEGKEEWTALMERLSLIRHELGISIN